MFGETVFLSTPTPGMKRSTVLDVGSIGMRCTAENVVPFWDVTKTRSFVEQPLRKRQSSQTTKIVPSPATSAEGRGLLRMPPGSTFAVIDVIVNALPKLTPPFVDLVNPSAVSDALSSGTTTLPFGWTTGWPPITPTFGVVVSVQLRPPSVEKAIFSQLPWAKLAHSA